MEMRPGDFMGKVALVLGGASGIGRATAVELARQGAVVAIGDVDEGRAQSVATEIAADGAEASAHRVDVADRQQVVELVRSVRERHARIDVMVQAVGWDRVVPFLETEEAFWHQVFRVNFWGVVNACHAVLPVMVEQGGGVVVNLASEAGRVGSSGESIYAASKGAVIALSKSLAREMARFGIRINVVAPGITDTPLLGQLIDAGHGKLIDAIVRGVPLRRMARPEEVAAVVVFLASDRASFMTGQTVSVSGGLTMI